MSIPKFHGSLSSNKPRIIQPRVGLWSPRHQSFHPSIFAIIEGLDRPVRVALDNHEYTMSPKLLDDFTRLEPLDVSLLNKPSHSRHSRPAYSSFDGITSKCVAMILQRNRGLKHLSIRLDVTNNTHISHDLLLTEQSHAFCKRRKCYVADGIVHDNVRTTLEHKATLPSHVLPSPTTSQRVFTAQPHQPSSQSPRSCAPTPQV